MPRIEGYTQNILPQGVLGGQASAADFGAQIGQGLQQFGAGVGELAERTRQIEEDQGRLWAYGATADAYEKLKSGFTKSVNALNPSDPKFSENFQGLVGGFPEQIRAATQDLMTQAPSKAAQLMVQSHMASNGRALSSMAASEAARVNAEWTLNQEDTNTKRDQDSIAADPSNENFSLKLNGMRDRIGGLSTLDPAVKMKGIAKLTHDMATTQTQVWFSTDPEGALRMVDAKGGRLTSSGVKGSVPGGAPVEITSDTPTLDQVWPLVVKQESGGRQGAVSPKGAVGVAQVMPKTGPEAAALAGLPWDEGKFKTDAAYNEALGKAYFKKQLETFGGDYTKALAAYNAGPSAVAQLIQQHGDAWLQFAPDETKGYVVSISAGVPSSAAATPTSRPQVEPLTEQDIAKAKPAIAGWGYLTWPEKVQLVRQAEAVLGARLASDRSQMDKDLKDAHATLMAGKNYPDLDSARFSRANLTRIYGEVNGPRAYDELQFDRKVGGTLQNLVKMPVAQALNTIKALEPEGGYEFADKSPVYQHLVQSFQAIQTERNKDYMQWAQTNGVGNVQPVDFSSPEAFGRTIGARIAAAKMGVSEYQAPARLMSESEASLFGDVISRERPDKQAAYLKMLRYATVNDPDWYADALKQIAPKNTSLAFAGSVAVKQGAVQTEAGWQNGEQVARYVLEGAHLLQGNDIDDPKKTGRPTVVNENMFRNAFWSAVGYDAFGGPNAQLSGQAANDTYQAVKNYLVADLYHRGVNTNQVRPSDVANAVKAVTGGSAHVNGSSVFIPWGMSKSDFERKFPVAVAAALTEAGLKGGPLDAPDGFQYRNADDGRYFVLNANNQPLVGKHGAVLVSVR